MCPTVENPVLVHQETGNSQGMSHPRPAEYDSGKVIQTRPDNSNRMVISNQVDFRTPPLKAIADFLLHLFQDRKLHPSTIGGYRSAIADKLGNSTINVSKDESVFHLLDSFYNRPTGRRGIPSWNLSLVLHQLTKAPFKPLKEASLKHLTFKTFFCWP